MIPKTWRSEFFNLALFFVLSVVSLWLTRRYPSSLVSGDIFSIGETTVYMTLPVFWLIPATFLGTAIYRIYNVRYSVDSRGLEEKTGILGFRIRTTQVRFEDIRSIEYEQTLLERALRIGEIEVGTAASGGIEIMMRGIGAPDEVQEMIQKERDRRIQLNRSRYGKQEDRLAQASP